MALRRLDIQDYTVGWVCALPIELAAATAMLDEEHQSLPQDNDPYLYTLGRIGEHNSRLSSVPITAFIQPCCPSCYHRRRTLFLTYSSS